MVSEEFTNWPTKVFIENQGLTDPEKAMKAVNIALSGYFRFDHSTENATMEAFLEAQEHPIRPSSFEGAPDVEELMKALHASAIASENLIEAGLGNKAKNVFAKYILKKVAQVKKESGRRRYHRLRKKDPRASRSLTS